MLSDSEIFVVVRIQAVKPVIASDSEAIPDMHSSFTILQIILYCRMIQRCGCVYILTNQQHAVFYTGVTSDLINRIWQHKNKQYARSFTARYNCSKLVYYNAFGTIDEAIAEEKRIKGGSRRSKIDLVNGLNPEWKDLYDDLIKD